jgi:hypothetical protein
MSITFAIEPFSIRPASAEDGEALARLAQRDSAIVPRGRLLLAESGGEIRAAIAIDGGATIADPFHRTAELVALLRTRADQARGGIARRPRIIARTPPGDVSRALAG